MIIKILKIISKILPLAWASIIFILCILPANQTLSSGWSDKIEHFIAYFILAFLFRFSWVEIKTIRVLLLTNLFGLIIEITQSYIPSRVAEPNDLLANLIGSFAGTLLYTLIISYKKDKITQNM
jgi:VanZ family protein